MTPRFASRHLVCAAALCAAAGASALAAPANDMRVNAITITLPSTTAGTTVAATNEASTPSCVSDSASPDVWYKYVAAITGTVQWDLCGGTSYDSTLSVFEANTTGALGSTIACDDDGCGGSGVPSKLTMSVTSGHTYMIRVAGWNNATGTFTLTGSVPPPPPPLTPGPDVTVGGCVDMYNYGTATVNGVLTRAFAVGTDSWNIGDRPVSWISGGTLHPVIAQNMYRAKDGKFEQIGLSFLKHGFTSLNDSAYATCVQPPNGGAQLGVNCSDTYTYSLNGSQTGIGPRYDVNPITGVFSANWSSLVPTATATVGRRLQVADTDWNPATNAGAEYWVDTEYVTQDDANWNNNRNNVSARKVTTPTAGNYSTVGTMSFAGGTIQRTTALEVWAAAANAASPGSVQIVPVDFHEITQTAAYDGHSQTCYGRFWVASKVTNNGNGTWTYEYAIYNVNSHRAAAGFRLRLPAGAVVSGEGFHAPLYHSGDRIDNSPWLNSKGGSVMKFNYNPAYPTPVTVSGIGSVAFQPNYVYWGTMYNVRFTASVAPMTGTARLDLGRTPANGTGYQGNTLAISGIKVPTICTADMGLQGGTVGADGLLDNNDFVVFINSFFSNDMLIADIGIQGGTPGADNILDNNDFVVFINAFFSTCP